MPADKTRIGARLRAARRAARLSVDAMAEALRQAAPERERRRLPKLADLRRMIRGWEAGEHLPSERYRLLYAAALNITEAALFGLEAQPQPMLWSPDRDRSLPQTPDDEERLILTGQSPARLDAKVVGVLSATLASQRRIEDAMGSQAVVRPAIGNLELILRLLQEARGPLTGRLAATASEASQFAGWLHAAIGAHDAAGPLFDQALRLGLQADDDNLAATALSMRGHLAWSTGDLSGMAGLSQAAAKLATAAATRTVAIQQGGRALALLGDRQGALRAIGTAEETLTGMENREDPDSLYFYGAEFFTMQRGIILAYLAGNPAEHAEAADVITAGFGALPASVRESEWVAGHLVRAAAARAAAGDTAEAVRILRRVHAAVPSTAGGGKTRTDIIEVHRRMAATWPDDSDVLELGELLQEP
jgi:transcriptional regulator with XRE-family HTH domain